MTNLGWIAIGFGAGIIFMLALNDVFHYAVNDLFFDNGYFEAVKDILQKGKYTDRQGHIHAVSGLADDGYIA